MDLVKPPTASDDSRDNFLAIAQLARILNSLADLDIVESKTRNKLTLGEANAKLELKLGQGGGGNMLTWDVIVNGEEAQADFASSEPYDVEDDDDDDD